jgi:hypothetical protein
MAHPKEWADAAVEGAAPEGEFCPWEIPPPRMLLTLMLLGVHCVTRLQKPIEILE